MAAALEINFALVLKVDFERHKPLMENRTSISQILTNPILQFYTQKELDCDLTNLKLRIISVSNSGLYGSIFSKNSRIAILNLSLVL
jgi:hypothetical protein